LQHNATELRPFSFESKTREMVLDKEAKLAQVLEEEQRVCRGY